MEANPYDAQIYQQLIAIAKVQNDAAGAKKYEDAYRAMVAKVKAQTETQAGGTAGALLGATVVPEPGMTTGAAPAGMMPAGGSTAAPAPALPGAGSTAH